MVIFLAHFVTCKYCGERFDRDVKSYVEVSSRRYAHASCYLRDCSKNNIKPTLQIYDIENTVQCIYCKKTMHKTDNDCHQVASLGYAHIACIEAENKREKTDEEKLYIYLCDLFGTTYVIPAIRKQIAYYIKEYHYSYSGIQKALEYYYHIQGHPFDKNNMSIGIVPYIYQNAYNYYYNKWLLEQKNHDINAKPYVYREMEIIIPPPSYTNPLKKYFNFLDNDEVLDEE